MDWDGITSGFVDELAKIAEFNLSGLSPETVMEKSQPPAPMETPGFDKARNILQRAEQMKTAAARESKQVQRALPLQPGLGKLVHQGDNSTNEQAKSVGGYSLAGVGVGTAAHRIHSSRTAVHSAMNHPELSSGHRFAASAKNNALGHKLMVGGAVAGGLYGLNRLRQKAKANKQKTSSVTSVSSSGSALKASRQVGKVTGAPRQGGPSLHAQLSGQLIGNKGVY